MKKLLLIIGVITLITSISMCLNNSPNVNDLKKKILVEVNGTPIEIPLRASIGEAKEAKLVNTTDREIYNYYHSKILIYIQGDMSLKPEDGGVSIIDLITKLEWLNQFYPHNIVVELNRTNSTVTVKSIFANGKTALTELKINESNYLMQNNKTMVIKIIKTQNNATITRINNTFIIEGNSLKELDKAETRFVIAIFKGNMD